MPVMRGNTGGVRPGFIGTFAFDDTNPAWIDCDGRNLNVVDEPALFAAIGYTWGGAGAVFSAPLMNNDFIRGAGPGRPVGTREADEIKSHRHTVPTSYDNGSVNSGNNLYLSGDGLSKNYVAAADAIDVTGGDETRPRNVAAKFRIKR